MRLTNSSMQGPSSMGTGVDFEKFDWADISRRLTLYAKRRLGTRGNWQDAEQIAQEAIAHLLDPNYADWDSQKQPEILLQLQSIANSVLANYVRNWDNCRVTHNAPDKLSLIVEKQARTESALSTDGSDRSTNHDARKVVNLLSERLSQDQLGQEVLLLQMDGIDRPSEQAAALQRSVKDINNARRRLDGHLQAIKGILKQEKYYAD